MTPQIGGGRHVFSQKTRHFDPARSKCLSERTCIGVDKPCAVSTVSMQASNLAATVEGIGCLVASDENAGSFQEPGPLSDLLFGLSHQIEHLAALSGLATEVAHLQGYRAAGWAKAPEPKPQKSASN